MSVLAPETIDLNTLPTVCLTDRLRLPSLPGVYFVLNERKSVIYVGCTNSLRTRWYHHEALKQLLGTQDASIAWIIVFDQAQRFRLEYACILYFNPLYNRETISSHEPFQRPIYPPPADSFGKRIVACRQYLGVTQQHLAETMNMKQTIVSRLEHDRVPNPRAETLKRLVRALGCSCDYLIDHHYEENPLAPLPVVEIRPPYVFHASHVGAAS